VYFSSLLRTHRTTPALLRILHRCRRAGPGQQQTEPNVIWPPLKSPLEFIIIKNRFPQKTCPPVLSEILTIFPNISKLFQIFHPFSRDFDIWRCLKMVRTLICSRSSSLVPSKPIEILRGAMAVGPFLERQIHWLELENHWKFGILMYLSCF
jgi:hypothetical protein